MNKLILHLEGYHQAGKSEEAKCWQMSSVVWRFIDSFNEPRQETQNDLKGRLILRALLDFITTEEDGMIRHL